MSTEPEIRNFEVAKLSDVVYAKIVGLINAGNFPVNSKLPTEHEFAELLSVSRPVVREALARLRNDGVVVSRRGSGSYVRAPESAPRSHASMLGSFADLRNLLDFRISFEGESAFHAARGKPEDRESLIKAMRELEVGVTGESARHEEDFAFHFAIAEATGNRFFVNGTAAIREPVIAAMGVTTSFIPARSADRLVQLPREHRAIFDAIMANDAEAARAAMRAHLEHSKRRIFEGVDA